MVGITLLFLQIQNYFLSHPSKLSQAAIKLNCVNPPLTALYENHLLHYYYSHLIQLFIDDQRHVLKPLSFKGKEKKNWTGAKKAKILSADNVTA